jgi:hypothetical protein
MEFQGETFSDGEKMGVKENKAEEDLQMLRCKKASIRKS